MANRDSAPNTAFAFVTEIQGKTHRLLRHHSSDVQDGTEHDTVDVGLLKASLNLLEQLNGTAAMSTKEYEAARAHLMSHAGSVLTGEQPDDIQGKQPRYIRRDLENDPDMARRIISEQSGAPDGNQNLTNPRSEGEVADNGGEGSRLAEESLRQESGKGSITSPKSKGTEPGEKSTENPAGTKGDLKETQDEGPDGPDVDTKVKPKGGSTKVSETSEGKGENPGQHTEMPDDKNIGNPNADQQADVPKSSGSKKASATSTPTKLGKTPPKKAEPEKEDDQTPGPEGKSVDAKANLKKKKAGKKADERHQDPKKKVKKAVAPKHGSEHKKVKAEVGDWVRNAQNFVGVVTRINDSGQPVVRVPAGADQDIATAGWEVIVKASEVNQDDPASLLKNEMRILNSPEALTIFSQPTPEGQRARNCAIALASVDDLTEAGKAHLKDLFSQAMAGKVEASIESIDKLGSRELIDVRMKNENFTFFFMLEVLRDGDDKVHGIRLFDEHIPVEAFKDVAKFLRDLSKEGPKKSESAKAEAGEKLDK